MTALGGPSEADDERASGAPSVERESKVCKFTVTMIQLCAPELSDNSPRYLLGENDAELVSKCAASQVSLVCLLSQVPHVHFPGKPIDTGAK